MVVVDRRSGPAQEASAANGAQLSYAFVAPLASPETLRHLPALLLDRSGPLRVRARADPDFMRWGLAFLREELVGLASALPIRFGLRTAGKLVVFRHEGSFGPARRQAELQAGLGVEQQVLDAAACLALEPALRLRAEELAGGVYTPSEQVGDCAAFCRGLAGQLRLRNSVRWVMGEESQPVLRDGRLAAVRAGGEEVAADRFVLAFGSGSARFADAAGFRLPVQPLKGYSLTLRPRTLAGALRHSVTDADSKVVFAPLDGEDGPRIRVAGIADLVGYDRTVDPARLEAVRRAAAAALDVDLSGDTQPWVGLRPATPDSRPIIGPSPVPGLFLNTGHGALGWTLACGSARLTADLLLGAPPPVAAAPFALRRGQG